MIGVMLPNRLACSPLLVSSCRGRFALHMPHFVSLFANTRLSINCTNLQACQVKCAINSLLNTPFFSPEMVGLALPD